MTLSIIIVSYNVKYFLEQCLCSVTAATARIDAEVIVIDNASSDGSIAYLQPFFPSVHFIQKEANEGFARANNEALAGASGEYILFLNPDTILADDTLEQCLYFFRQHKNAGCLGVRMIDGSGAFLPESKRSFPSPMVSFYKLVGLSSLFPDSKYFGRYALGFLAEKGVHEVDVIAGAFMMVRAGILNSIGGFDERFFMYAEDIDLSYRIQKNGWKNYYLGNLTIVHFKGESTRRGSRNYVKIFYGAMSLFVKKWYRGGSAWLLRQALQTGITARSAFSLIQLPIKKIKKDRQPPVEVIFLIGEEVQRSKAKQIIEHYYPNIRFEDRENDIRLNSSFNNALLVFCIGRLSYKWSIELLQQQRASSYKWFGKESRSIVGSDDKNKSGEALTAN